MVLFQDFLGPRQVQLVLGPGAPRQLGDPLQKSADDLVLGRLRRRSVQSAELPIHLLARRLAEIEGGQTLPELVQVVPLAFFPQLLSDLLHLLPQEHLPLTFAEFFLNLGLDVLLGVEAHESPLDGDEHRLHPLLVLQQLHQLLLLGGLQVQVERHQVRKGAWVLHSFDQLADRLRRHALAGAQLRRPLPKLRVQCQERRVLAVGWSGSLHQHQRRPQHRLAFVQEGDCPRPRFALDQQLDAASHSVGLDDPNHGAHGVEDLGVGLVLIVALGYGEEPAVALHRLLDRLDRSRPACRDRYSHARIDHRVPKRKHRQREPLFHVRATLIVSCLPKSGPAPLVAILRLTPPRRPEPTNPLALLLHSHRR